MFRTFDQAVDGLYPRGEIYRANQAITRDRLLVHFHAQIAHQLVNTYHWLQRDAVEFMGISRNQLRYAMETFEQWEPLLTRAEQDAQISAEMQAKFYAKYGDVKK